MFSLSTPETRTLAVVAYPGDDNLSTEPYAIAVGPDVKILDTTEVPEHPLLLAEVIHYDVQDMASAWDIAESLGADPEASATVLFGELLTPEEREGYATDARHFRSPEPATDADAVRCWVESDPEVEVAAVRHALERAGLGYISVPSWIHPTYTDAIVRFIDAD